MWTSAITYDGGSPLQRMVDPSATPVAIHTPVPVPIHWRDDIKAGLDRDVRLGVIEPVPVVNRWNGAIAWSFVPRKMANRGAPLCIDDTLLWSNSLEESFFQACNWLDICGRNGITLNPEKFIFGQETVEFAGFEITAGSVRPCRKFLYAIIDFPQPRNITDIRSWFGLINQVSYAFRWLTKCFPSLTSLIQAHPSIGMKTSTSYWQNWSEWLWAR